MEKNILYKKVKDLKPYARNSRKHPNKQIETLVKSIKENGFTSVLVVDEHNTVLSGHGRLEAAKRLCMDELPCIVVSNWTEQQKKQYVISDNQIGLMSEWDNDILASEIESLSLDIDLSVLGFDDKFLSKLFDETGGVTISDEIEVDDIGELKVKFPEEKRIEVMNAISSAIKDMADVHIWCNDEQVSRQENE